MDSKSRKAIQPIYETLPPSFVGEKFDDFINHASPDGGNSTTRAIRFVGPSRCVVVFSYSEDPDKSRWAARNYDLLYLHEDGSLTPFDLEAIKRAWVQTASPGQTCLPWDKEVGKWLVMNGAKQFAGTNWVGKVAETLTTLLPQWEQDHSGRHNG